MMSETIDYNHGIVLPSPTPLRHKKKKNVEIKAHLIKNDKSLTHANFCARKKVN